MRYWPLAFLFPLAAVQAHAGESPAASQLSVQDALPEKSPAFNIRLVGDRQNRSARVGDAGMIASTNVAPNATLGIGLLKTAPRKSNDWRLGTRYSPRKAAVNFQLKF